MKGTLALPPRASLVERRAFCPEEPLTKPRRGAYQASARLLHRHRATDFLELVGHRPNVASRGVGRKGNPSRHTTSNPHLVFL